MNAWKVLGISLVPVLLLSAGCTSPADTGPTGDRASVRQDMRDLVQAIGAYTRATNPNFIVIPQNGHAIITETDDPTETPNATYLAAIDGIGREDLLYGYVSDNVATPAVETTEIMGFLDLYEANGVEVLVTDYINTPTEMDISYVANNASGYISFAADSRGLDRVPTYPNPATPYHYSGGTDAATLGQAANFLYVLDPSGFADIPTYLAALGTSNHDVLIIDAFDGTGTGTALTAAQVTALKTKADGGSRLVIAYMSIGEAETYRYYWQSSWNASLPAWIEAENPDWPGNFKVKYWDAGWQSIIYGNDTSYARKILDGGFDGVYLDIIDGYEYFEALGW